MSVILVKTDNSEAYAIQVHQDVDLHEEDGVTEMNMGEFLKFVVLKGLLESDVTLGVGRYRVQGTICIQEITDDETDGPQG